MRYKITFNLSSPVIMYEPLMFDSLIMYYYIKNQFGYVPQLLEYKEEDAIKLPDGLLKEHGDGYYYASMMQSTDEPLLDNSTFIKQWFKGMQHIVKDKPKILTTKGPYKNYNLTYETKNYSSVYFVIDTENIELIKELLSNCYSIGKKHNRGYGQVSSIEFEQTDLKILRPIPSSEPTIYIRLKPPYWSYLNMIGCDLKEI